MRVKADIERIYMEMFAYQVQLLDTTFISRALAFAGLVSAWLIRMVDPKNQHPSVVIEWVPPIARILFDPEIRLGCHYPRTRR